MLGYDEGMDKRFFLICLICLFGTSHAFAMGTPAAPPIKVQEAALDADWRETIPVTIVAPETARKPLQVILFSTGAFSSPQKYMALLKPWAEAGYAVIAPLHVDSESWTGARPKDQSAGITWRMWDMVAVLEGFDALEAQTGLRFSDKDIAATGHSFGALIAQVLGGARAGDVGPIPGVDIAAIVAYSPPGPIPNYIQPDGWAQMTVPQLLITGTADIVPGMADDWRSHLAAHEAHPGPSWSLVKEGADHYFGNVYGRTEYPGPAQQIQFDETVPVTITFLDALIKGGQKSLTVIQSAKERPGDQIGLNKKAKP